MAEEPTTAGEGGRKDSSSKGLTAAIARKALEPIAAGVATAAAAYLTRKSSELWRGKIAPKVREQGGARAVTQGALETASRRLGERGSATLSRFAGRLSDVRGRDSRVPVAERQAKPTHRREEERRERERRRQERQRALERSGSS